MNDSNDLPDWLTTEMFTDFFHKNLKDFNKILELRVKKALPPGENYISTIIRIKIDVEFKDGSHRRCAFIMKIANSDDTSQSMQREHNVFDVEHGMYYDVIPEWEQMYKDAGCEVKFGAKYYSLKTEKNCIFLEDLQPLGFKNVSRLEGLDMEHTKAVLKKLAQWHAASAVRIETKGLYSEMYGLGMFMESSKPMMKEMNKNLSSIFLEYLKDYENNADYYSDVENFQNNFVDLLFKAALNDQNEEFRVLNHGDFWSNNIMFRYDSEGKIKETLLIDFQIPRCGSPAHDLLFFLIASTKYELKIKCFEYFIKYYHDQLVKYLQLLKYPKKIPTLIDIHITCLKNGIWAYFVATGALAAFLLESNEGASLENFVGDSLEAKEFKKLLYSNERYKKHMEIILPWLQNRGTLEC